MQTQEEKDYIEKLRSLSFSSSAVDNTTRDYDMKLISQGLKSKDPNDRRQASIAYQKINREDGRIRSMREKLVKAHRMKDKEEVKDIHDYVEKHPLAYKNA